MCERARESVSNSVFVAGDVVAVDLEPRVPQRTAGEVEEAGRAPRSGGDFVCPREGCSVVGPLMEDRMGR